MKEKFIEFLKKEGVYERVKAYALAEGQPFDEVISEHGHTVWLLVMFNWHNTDEGFLFWVKMDRKWSKCIEDTKKVQADTANEKEKYDKLVAETIKNDEFWSACNEFEKACENFTSAVRKYYNVPSPVKKPEPTLANLLKAMEEIGINGDTLFDKVGRKTYEYSDDKMRILFIRK